MEGNAILTLLRTDGLEEPEDRAILDHLERLVGPVHIVAAWLAAKAAVLAVEDADGSGDQYQKIEVRPAVWFTARQVIEALDLERFCNTHLKALQLKALQTA